MISDDIFHRGLFELYSERMRRILNWRRLNGSLGFVNRPMAAFLLSVSRQRLDVLLSQGRLKSVGHEGFRLLSVASLLEFSKVASKRKCKRRLLERNT